MARKEVVRFIDDIDGQPIEGGGQTIEFAYRGIEYEIDLRPQNVKKFEKALELYLSAARRTSRRRDRRSPRIAAASSNKSQLDAIRLWARENGYEVSNRGRISQSVREAFDADH